MNLECPPSFVELLIADEVGTVDVFDDDVLLFAWLRPVVDPYHVYFSQVSERGRIDDPCVGFSSLNSDCHALGEDGFFLGDGRYYEYVPEKNSQHWNPIAHGHFSGGRMVTLVTSRGPGIRCGLNVTKGIGVLSFVVTLKSTCALVSLKRSDGAVTLAPVVFDRQPFESNWNPKNCFAKS